MGDFTAEAQLAKDLIAENGVTVTVRRVTDGTSYNPVLDQVTGSSVVTYQAKAVVLPLFNRPELRDQYMVIGTGIISDHSKLLMSAFQLNGSPLPFPPSVSDTIIFGTLGSPNFSWWKVDSHAELAPDTTPLLYTVLVTRGMGDLWEPSFSA